MMLPVYPVILILFATHFCVANKGATDYYFSSFCQYRIPGNQTIQTTRSGRNSTGSIRPNSTSSWYSNGLDCTLVLNPPPGYNITLRAEKINLRSNGAFCMDTITIQSRTSTYPRDTWRTDLGGACSISKSPKFSNNGPMRIIFSTSYSPSPSTAGRDFRIVYSSSNTFTRNPGAIAGGVIFLLLIFGKISL